MPKCNKCGKDREECFLKYGVCVVCERGEKERGKVIINRDPLNPYGGAPAI
jgi:hypothetical protein